MSKKDAQNAFAIGIAAKGVISSGIEPLDHTVTFMVDGAPYEVVSVKNGNAVNAPIDAQGNPVVPTSASGSFSGWGQRLPFVPTSDVKLNAIFGTYADELYTFYNIDKLQYPYVIFTIQQNGFLQLYFFERYTTDSLPSYINVTNTYNGSAEINGEITDYNNYGNIIEWIKVHIKLPTSIYESRQIQASFHIYTTFDCDVRGTLHRLDQ